MQGKDTIKGARRMKRFKLGYSGKLYSSEIYCDNELMITADVVDLLNELATKCSYLKKENEQLKHDATVLIYSNQEYRKENEQLKEEIKDLNDILARYEERVVKE